MPEDLKYDVAIRVLSPLHIGTGVTLLKDYDYAVHGGRTWRLNLDALLDEKADDPAVQRGLDRVPPAELLRPADYVVDGPAGGSRLFQYTLAGEPRARGSGAQLQEQIKDVWGRPYLPGSSLKGALRTALLCHGLGEQSGGVDLSELGRNARWAAQGLERSVMGRNPNEDLLRALLVADSEPLSPDCLRLANCQVVGAGSLAVPQNPGYGRPVAPGGAGAPVEVEAIRAGTTFRTRIKVDRALFDDWAGRAGLHRHSGRDWLEDLPRIVQAHSQRRVELTLARWRRSADNSNLLSFYNALRNVGEDACYLQVGWGTGWDGVTVGSILDGGQVEWLVKEYRLSRSPRRRPGDPFPASRRMALKKSGAVAGPLGWVRLTFNRR